MLKRIQDFQQFQLSNFQVFAQKVGTGSFKINSTLYDRWLGKHEFVCIKWKDSIYVNE